MTDRNLADEARFAIGTYTRLPVPPPAGLDAGLRVGAWLWGRSWAPGSASPAACRCCSPGWT